MGQLPQGGQALRFPSGVTRAGEQDPRPLPGPLGPRLRKTTLVAGAAVLPNGRVALTLAPGKMVGAATASDAASDRAQAVVRKKLLVVDDSLTTRSLARSILESAGFDVITAGDGLEAWRLLEIEGADLVVSDV